MEYHIDCLKKLCRVCGEVITKHRVTYECTQKRELLLVGNIDISHDKETVHPGFFCNKCYSTLTHIKNEKVQTSGLKTVQWAEHNSDYRCETCMRRDPKVAESARLEGEGTTLTSNMARWFCMFHPYPFHLHTLASSL